jgi:hypothetical protein
VVFWGEHAEYREASYFGDGVTIGFNDGLRTSKSFGGCKIIN